MQWSAFASILFISGLWVGLFAFWSWVTWRYRDDH